jgi:predicted nucleic acid-binding protein
MDAFDADVLVYTASPGHPHGRRIRTLLAVDSATAQLATVLGAQHRLRAADAVHLATAVNTGADRFITNNQSDFSARITEIEVLYLDQLPDL